MKVKYMSGFIAVSMVSLLLAGILPTAAVSADGAPIQAASGLEVQLIADQTSAAPSGQITYHLLYHNAAVNAMDHAVLKAAITGKAAFQDMGGGVKDEATGTLQWKLPNLAPDGAGEIHFSLKASADAAVGDVISLGATASDGLGINAAIPSVSVRIGTDIRQPAFIGYPDGGFHPQGNLTRAETAAIVSRLKQLAKMAGSPSYSDVPSSNWAYAYIEKVTDAGWMQGDNGQFHPDAPITRSELAVILLRIRGIRPLPLTGFADTLGNWASLSIGTAKILGYVSGDENGNFHGESTITREEAAKLLNIALSRGELVDGTEKVAQHWPDVPRTAWSFGWVEGLSLVAHECSPQGGMKDALVRYWPDKTQPL